ncbi:MAG TPA: ATP-dependent 6-phosphofructokinase [bacterium]|nr:ATP-dependent 6-phosphofructokinase [bacterium]
MSKTQKKRIGVLTGGGDCPGLNAVIRGVVKASIGTYDLEVIGIEDGYEGLIERRVVPMNWKKVSGILTQGGTILGSSNIANPFRWPVKDKAGKRTFSNVSDRVAEYVSELNLSNLVCIGGDGTMAIAHKLSQMGIRLIGVPKTIDNDIWGTDITFGFDSALGAATDAIDRIHSTAMSHHRVMVVEVMGRYAGWLALESGLAAGGDVILIPEIPLNMDIVCDFVVQRSTEGRRFSIVVVAEGVKAPGGKQVVKKIVENSTDPIRLGGIGHYIARLIETRTKLESRVTVLGHLQRGGTPSAYDRILATRFGVKAAELCYDGVGGVMVALRGTEIVTVPLSDVAGKSRTVPENHPLIEVARHVGTCLGDTLDK